MPLTSSAFIFFLQYNIKWEKTSEGTNYDTCLLLNVISKILDVAFSTINE